EVHVAVRATDQQAVAMLRDPRARAAPVDLRVDRFRGPGVNARVHAVREPEAPVAQRAVGNGNLSAAKREYDVLIGHARVAPAARDPGEHAGFGAVATLEPERRELRGALEILAGQRAH